jgi:amidase
VKRFWLLLLLGTSIAVAMPRAKDDDSGKSFHLVEATVADIQHAFRSGVIDPVRLVRMYLARIAAYDQAGPHLNAFMHLNARAVDDARRLDRHGRGDDDDRDDDHDQPLFGIPIVLKDNVDTADMPTTAGSVALGGSVPPDDAFIAAKIRRAGAVILGKATLTEYANFLTNGMPAGYSSQLRFQLGGGTLVGYGFNPFDPRTDPRTGFNDGRPALSPGGSSSGPGIAVSANLAAIGIGTETSGSILSPGTQNLLVGIKPTVGLVSRDGIVPITADQDTAGPLARTVTDAARLLGVIAGFDPHDPATNACRTPGNCFSDYTRFLNKHALRGARIAVPFFSYWTNTAGTVNLTPTQQAVMNDAIAVLRAEGAFVEEHHDIPTQAELNAFPGCGPPPGPPFPTGCSTVLLFGFKRDLNTYLASLGAGAPVHTIDDVVAFNNAHASVALKYGQFLAISSSLMNTSAGSADTIRYLADRAKDIDIARTRGLDAVYNGPDGIRGTADDFDAVLFPANRGANIAARAGYPSIVVPGGFVTNRPELNVPPGLAFPDGFDPKDAPYGVTFSGRAFSEPRLIALAYAFEQATHHRVAPASVPPLPSDTVKKH